MSLSKEKRRKEDGTMKMASMGICRAGADRLSHLPPEIQLHILQNLDYVEFSRFAAVCKAWRLIASGVKQSPFFRLQQVPWLIQRVSSRQADPKLSHQKMLYKLELFGVRELSCICGSSQGWLLLRRYSRAFLLNPITRQRIPLPRNPKSILQLGVILPHQSADEISVVAYFDDYSFYQWRSQDKHWTVIAGRSKISTVSHMLYHKGNIYTVNDHNLHALFIINISSDRPYGWLRFLSPYTCDLFFTQFKQLVECDGDLLMVVVSSLYGNLEATVDVSVFKYINTIDYDGSCWEKVRSISCWEKVRSIGEKYALLVGKGNSMAIDVSTNNASFTANCVYFLEYDLDQEIRCFDLGSNTFRIFMPHNWFARRRGDTICIPTWFMPSLT